MLEEAGSRGGRRMSQQPSVGSPLPLNQREFLKRGNGHGGAPTNFDVQEVDNRTSRLGKRQGSTPTPTVTVRYRQNSGAYEYSKASLITGLQRDINSPS